MWIIMGWEYTLPWDTLVSASSFKCSLDNAKRSFYRSFNAILGKVGRIASNEVIVQLTKSKCFPAVYYALEACPLRERVS